MFYNLINRFADDREFFDDDPLTTLDKFGIREEDFTKDSPWDQFPIIPKHLEIWQVAKEYVAVFVDKTYRDDNEVENDQELQTWINKSATVSEHSIRGLHEPKTRDDLKQILTSFLYRLTMHGASRLSPSANPGFTFVPNFPPCLERADIPSSTSKLNTQELFTYLPKTGTMGGVLTFFYIFIFSAPYESFIPREGNDTNFFFPEGLRDPRNIALAAYREKVQTFIPDTGINLIK